MNSRRAWAIFAVGLVGYITAITLRSSLGVAGVSASERFQVPAASLALLGASQVLVYAGMQIPVGIILTRIGPRAMLICGALLMLAGQLVTAFAPSLGIALVGRILLGAGDATIFTSVLRLCVLWFSGKILASLNQILGSVGQLGQVLSAVPFFLLLGMEGWTVAFASSAGLALLTLALVLAVIKDAPRGSHTVSRVSSVPEALSEFTAAFSERGTRVGFWAHFITGSSAVCFTVFWGVPYMVNGLGFTTAEASSVLVVTVAAAVISGPIIGYFSGRFPRRRAAIVLSCCAAIYAWWAVMLLWPSTPSFAMAVVLGAVVGVGGPASMVGFDYSRHYNPVRSQGAANGIVNVGGFIAGVAMILLVGLALDVQFALGLHDSLYEEHAFRVAFLSMAVVAGIGAIFFTRGSRRLLRAT